MIETVMPVCLVVCGNCRFLNRGQSVRPQVAVRRTESVNAIQSWVAFAGRVGRRLHPLCDPIRNARDFPLPCPAAGNLNDEDGERLVPIQRIGDWVMSSVGDDMLIYDRTTTELHTLKAHHVAV